MMPARHAERRKKAPAGGPREAKAACVGLLSQGAPSGVVSVKREGPALFVARVSRGAFPSGINTGAAIERRQRREPPTVWLRKLHHWGHTTKVVPTTKLVVNARIVQRAEDEAKSAESGSGRRARLF